MIGLEHTWALFLAAPWALLVLAVATRQREALDWLRERVSARAFERLTTYARIRPRWHFLWLWTMGALLLAAAAGPYTESLGPVKREARDIVLLIDASLSMTAPDAGKTAATQTALSNRFEAARVFGTELIDALPDARFALVSFSGTAVIHSPVTVDRHAVRMQLQAIRPHRVGVSSGSEFGNALGKVAHLWRHREQPLQVVLLSDGDTSSDPEPFDAQVEALASLGIPVHTVAFGGNDTIYMNVFDPLQVAEGVKKPKVVFSFQTRRQEGTLREISRSTGGEALVAERHWVSDLLPALEAVPPSTVSLSHPTRQDWSHVLVALFAILFLAESRVFRRKLPVVVALLLVVPGSGCTGDEVTAHELNEQGRERFSEQRWAAAAEAFEQSSAFQVRPWVPTHNLAMVYARQGKFAEAHRLMEQSIVMDPDFAEGFFGDGAVLHAWGGAELDVADCRVERTRELWTRARERFAQAEQRSGFWGTTMRERAIDNQRFLDAQLAWLDEVERCEKPDAGPDGGTGSGGDGGADGGSDGGTDGGDDAGADAGEDAGSDAGPDAGSDGGADGGVDAGADGGGDGGADGGADGGGDAGSEGDEGGDAGGGSEAGPDGGLPSAGASEGDKPCGGMTEEEVQQVEVAIERARKEGAEEASSWYQVRESQSRLGDLRDGGGKGIPPIRW